MSTTNGFTNAASHSGNPAPAATRDSLVPSRGRGPKAPNRGLHASRLATDSSGLETALALQWERLCKGNQSLNGGWGVLDLLCTEAQDKQSWLGMGFGARTPLLDLDDSHRVVAATVVQWLGTEAGRSFLTQAFEKAGYRLMYEKVVD